MRKNLINNWAIQTGRMPRCELPKEVEDAFQSAVGGFVSMQFEPVLFVGSKAQNGMYYCIICKTTESAVPQRQDCKIVYIYQSASGVSTVTRIDDILLER